MITKKAGADNDVPVLIDSAVSPKEFRKNWARLIQKIYNVDPLLCPKCRGVMKIISFIEDKDVIEKILRHLGLWKTRNHGCKRMCRAAFEDEYVDFEKSGI